MADNEEQEQQVSSSSALFSDLVHHYQAEPEAEPELYTGLPLDEQPKQDLFSLDDIVDLVGGAQDALERHMAEDEEPHGFTEPHEEEPDLLDPQPDPVPHLREEQEAEEDEQLMPDSSDTSSFRHTPSLSDASREAEPQVCPESDALPASPATQPAAPSPAHAAQTPADTQPARAPVSCCVQGWNLNVGPRDAPSSPSKPQPLMQFPTVVDLLYWRDVKTTGVVFGAVLLLLLSLTACSIVSVCSYIGLALLSVTVCFRIYKGVLQAIQKSDEGHPFKQYLEREVTLSEDMVHKYSDVLLEKINKTVSELRRLFLVEDLVDSIKFAVLMWVLTYVGALFNGLTLVILAVIGAFSCPIIYEKHQAQIDRYLALVNNQIKDIVGKIQAKVPGMKRKAE
ncbi:reticulon-3-B-like isoform X8 [Hippocampus comes]|uniref:reticulon-3-B-like isoform X8 n=1 Tax=Hippocampus comes TaxID=109280 RepID=UPI00094E6BC7|nr:PREDICTED: reticulon-3-B-like isoform X8 [Hippocampus comes]